MRRGGCQFFRLSHAESYLEVDYWNEFLANELGTISFARGNITKEMNKLIDKNVRITNDMDITMYSTIQEINKRKSVNYYNTSEEIWKSLTKEEKRLIGADFIEDIIVKYGYGVSNTYKVNVIVNEKKEVTITNINFRESKIFNLVYMMREKLMDMVIKKDNKNILVSSPQTKFEIDKFISQLETKYDIKTLELNVDDIKFENIDADKVVKIMPIKNNSTNKKQKYRIITI